MNAYSERLSALLAWQEQARWHAGEPGPMRAIALRLANDVAILIEELQDEIVDVYATPAERQRRQGRLARSVERSTMVVTWQWQQTERRKAYLADRAEEARDRQRAIGRMWAKSSKESRT